MTPARVDYARELLIFYLWDPLGPQKCTIFGPFSDPFSDPFLDPVSSGTLEVSWNPKAIQGGTERYRRGPCQTVSGTGLFWSLLGPTFSVPNPVVKA